MPINVEYDGDILLLLHIFCNFNFFLLREEWGDMGHKNEQKLFLFRNNRLFLLQIWSKKIWKIL